jgi:hypothetical protein
VLDERLRNRSELLSQERMCGIAAAPRNARSYSVRTYMVVANTWQEAQARARSREPRPEFVTVPREVPDVLMLDDELMSKREIADLRSACRWNEGRLRDGTS